MVEQAVATGVVSLGERVRELDGGVVISICPRTDYTLDTSATRADMYMYAKHLH